MSIHTTMGATIIGSKNLFLRVSSTSARSVMKQKPETQKSLSTEEIKDTIERIFELMQDINKTMNTQEKPTLRLVK